MACDALFSPPSSACRSACTVESLTSMERKGMLPRRGEIAASCIDSPCKEGLVDRIMRTCKRGEFGYGTFFAATHLFEAVLARDASITREDVKLICIACISLSAKHNEMLLPYAKNYLSSTKWEVSDLFATEERVLALLGCNLNVPREIEYLRYLLASHGSSVLYKISRNLLMLVALAGSDFLPSVVVSAAVSIVCSLYSRFFANFFAIPDDTLEACKRDIIVQCVRLRRGSTETYKDLRPKEEWNGTLDMICNMPVDPSLGTASTVHIRSTYYRKHPCAWLSNLGELGVGRRIGGGAYGVVQRLDCLGAPCAVKIFDPEEGMDSRELTTSFLREISVLQLLAGHSGIVEIKCVSIASQAIVMELAHCDLYSWLSTRMHLSTMQMQDLAEQMFSALAYVHSMGCLHRDIKPQNILVFPSTSSVRFALCDFGAARGGQIVSGHSTFTGGLTTLWYRAPELLIGVKAYGEGIDVWSLMCTLYQCDVGSMLFAGENECRQLQAILSVLGTPTEQSWPGISKLPMYALLAGWDKYERKPCIGCGMSPVMKRVVDAGLELCPDKRASASTLLDLVRKV